MTDLPETILTVLGILGIGLPLAGVVGIVHWLWKGMPDG